MNIKYDKCGVRNIFLKKVHFSERLTELKIPIADDFLVHNVLNLLPAQFAT